jgi:hypothetical protein
VVVIMGPSGSRKARCCTRSTISNRFGPQGVRSDSSEEAAPGVFVEFDPNGKPIGIEVISVRRRNDEIAAVQAAAKQLWP